MARSTNSQNLKIKPTNRAHLLLVFQAILMYIFQVQGPIRNIHVVHIDINMVKKMLFHKRNIALD